MKKQAGQLEESTKRLFTGTEVGVLLEDIDKKLGILAEGQGSLIKRINKIESKLDATFEMVGEMKIDITMTKIDITAMKNDLETIKKSLNKKPDGDEFKELESRVLVLENKINI